MIFDGEDRTINARNVWWYALTAAMRPDIPQDKNPVINNLLEWYAVWRTAISKRNNQAIYN